MNKFQILIIGDKKVGKTKLCYLLMNDKSKDEFKPTIMYDYFSIKHDNVNIGLWDTSSEVNFHIQIPNFIQSSHVIVLVCSRNNDSIVYVNNFLNNYGDEIMYYNCQCILVQFLDEDDEDNSVNTILKDKHINIFKILKKTQDNDVEKLYNFLINSFKKFNKKHIENNSSVKNNKKNTECFII